MHVIVVGGGAIGVTTAYFLRLRGADVTVLEKNRVGFGASYGNAGLLAPSDSLPIPSIDNLREGLRSLVGMPSAGSVRYAWGLKNLHWFFRFAGSALPAASRAGLETLAALTQRSLALYADLMQLEQSISYSASGLLYVYSTAPGFAKGCEVAARLNSLGVKADVLRPDEARRREPLLNANIAGAVSYPGNAHFQPWEYVQAMADAARSRGVCFQTAAVRGFRLRDNHRTAEVDAEHGTIRGDYVVLAAGAWSPPLIKAMGLCLPVVPVKGYSLDFRLRERLQTPLVLAEPHVAVTPMHALVRASTGLDFHGFDMSINPSRLNRIRSALREHLNSPTILASSDPWTGFRPLTPDGLPIVGRSSRVTNLIYATGHGILGMTLAPATAELVCRAICDQVGIDLRLSPDRFRL